MELKHAYLTNQILKAFYDVYNTLGHGFLERVYQNALFFELQNRGFTVEAQKRIKVYPFHPFSNPVKTSNNSSHA